MRAKKQLVETDVVTYFKAFRNWKTFYGHNEESSRHFWFYLNLDRIRSLPVRIPYHTDRKVKLLASEHWYVALKAYEGRKKQ